MIATTCRTSITTSTCLTNAFAKVRHLLHGDLVHVRVCEHCTPHTARNEFQPVGRAHGCRLVMYPNKSIRLGLPAFVLSLFAGFPSLRV